MKSSLTIPELARFTSSQMNTFFPDGNPILPSDILRPLRESLGRLECCLKGLISPHFTRDGEPFFFHLHSDQSSMYLYLLANTAFKLGGEKNLDLARKAYLLNKALHGLEVFYENNLPEIFWFAHSVGSVIGRASYGNRLMVMQGCTVGNKGGKYPVFGDRVVLCAGSKVLGGVIGSGVCIGAGSLLIEETIPDNSIVVGSSPNIRVLQRKSQLINRYFSE